MNQKIELLKGGTVINKAIILSLDKRMDMVADLHNQCIAKGWNTELFVVGSGSDPSLEYNWVDPIDTDPRWNYASGVSSYRHYCAHLSHRKILQKAIAEDYPSILLLEDDAILLSRLESVLSGLEDQIQSANLDLLYLGHWAFEIVNHKHAGYNLMIEDMYKNSGLTTLLSVDRCGGFHGVLINKSAYSKLLSLPPVAPFDHQVNLNSHMFRRRIVCPKVVHVRSCFSHCENEFVERDVL